MDDDYDFDTYDTDLEDLEDLADELDDELDDSDDGTTLSDADIELAGSLDGELDSRSDTPIYSSYGSSIDLDSLTDEQRDLYDSGYHAGHDSGESQSL